MNIGEFLKQKRLEKGYSLRELAENVKKSNPFISDIENEKAIPSEETLENICNILDIDTLTKKIILLEILIKKSPESIKGELNLLVNYLKKNKVNHNENLNFLKNTDENTEYFKEFLDMFCKLKSNDKKEIINFMKFKLNQV